MKNEKEVQVKIIEAISRVDALVPNGYASGQKILWLSQLEALVHNQVLRETVPFVPFSEDTDTQGELTMEAPFDAAYLYWLEAQIHYANEEIELYNGAIRLFSDAYRAFQLDYHGKHGAGALGRFRF